MLAKVHCSAVQGIVAHPVEVEVNDGYGETLTVIVGLPDAAVRESRDRVTTALGNSGFKMPLGRTTINLAPADIRKEGPSFDLSIAVGMLAASGQIESNKLDQLMMIGELALTGAVRPLLDRVDLHVEVPQVKFQEITAKRDGEPSAAIRERVIAARQLQEKRFDGNIRLTCNARMQAREIKQHCQLGDEPKNLLRMTMSELNPSARAYDRILKVSRTIADLAGADEITSEHLSETLQYRTLDRQLWA